MRTASLPMYDLPELKAATDAWWAGLASAFLREGLNGVPDRLSRSDEVASLWGRDDLIFSQTCGYPLTHDWAGRLACVAAPCYACEGCEGVGYCSFVLVRRDSEFAEIADLRGACAAYNGVDSQSGYSALRAVVAPHAVEGKFFSTILETGAHARSLEAVAGGRADVCAVDAVLWTLLRRHRSDVTDRVRVIARSPQVPGLPYVTAPSASASDLRRLRAGLKAAVADTSLAEIRAALAIEAVLDIDSDAYAPILHMERAAQERGYPRLA